MFDGGHQQRATTGKSADAREIKVFSATRLKKARRLGKYRAWSAPAWRRIEVDWLSLIQANIRIIPKATARN